MSFYNWGSIRPEGSEIRVAEFQVPTGFLERGGDVASLGVLPLGAKVLSYEPRDGRIRFTYTVPVNREEATMNLRVSGTTDNAASEAAAQAVVELALHRNGEFCTSCFEDVGEFDSVELTAAANALVGKGLLARGVKTTSLLELTIDLWVPTAKFWEEFGGGGEGCGNCGGGE